MNLDKVTGSLMVALCVIFLIAWIVTGSGWWLFLAAIVPIFVGTIIIACATFLGKRE